MDDSMIKKIAALLEKAESTEFGPERDALRDKAQELMVKWQIEEWQLDEARAARGESIVNKIETIEVFSSSEFKHEFLEMLQSMARTMGCQCVWYGWDKNAPVWRDGRPGMVLKVVGYEMDLKYLEMLYANLMMEAAATLEAKPDLNLSFEENIWRLHESAVQWERVRILMNQAQERGAGWRRIPGAYAYTDDDGKFHPGASDGGVMVRAYKKWCAELGVEPHTIVNGKRYRYSYVKGFTKRIVERFWYIHHKATGEPGTALVLRDRNLKVKHKYNELFPNTRDFEFEESGMRMLDSAARRGAAAADRADLSKPGSKMGSAQKTAIQ